MIIIYIRNFPYSNFIIKQIKYKYKFCHGETLNLDVFGEEYEYLVGDIGQEMFPVAKQFFCEHCRKDL